MTKPEHDPGAPGAVLVPFLQAVVFAADRHRLQKRKDVPASPYINHPLALAERIATVGGCLDLATLQAAVLHDTIEDTETTREEIDQRFGAEVAGLVLEVTDDKHLEKAERKRLQLEHAAHLSPKAKVVKIADKLCNVEDVADRPPADWSRDRRREYVDWCEAVARACGPVNAGLQAALEVALERARTTLGQHV